MGDLFDDFSNLPDKSTLQPQIKIKVQVVMIKAVPVCGEPTKIKGFQT